MWHLGPFNSLTEVLLLFMGQCGLYEHLMMTLMMIFMVMVNDNADDMIMFLTMIMMTMASEHLLEFLVGIVDDKLFEAVRLEGLKTVQV